MRVKNIVLIILLGLIAFNGVKATHIVGGEITYRCLGNNNYEIAVTVYRDCDTGVPWFDNPASIGVFDSGNQLLMDLRLSLRNNDTLDLFLTDTCFVAPPNVCIHKTTYLDTVNLPFRTGGYQLVYQRCCRNQDIVNIVNPLGTGATYMLNIPETALNSCNSSPVFRDYPPVYLCRNVPIRFDHSAFDADADSVVYELYTPYDGATPLNPMPQPPFNPPYMPLTWIAPYSLQNVLGGADILRIDRHSGLLQGTPSNLGVFVVGIRALEYRNGQLIGVIQRDFQYAIGECGRRDNAAFFAPRVECNNELLVSFLNQSQTFSGDYRWDFGDLNTVADSSRLPNPVYIYPDTGNYRVRLVVAPYSSCSDTFYRDISVQYHSLRANFVATVAGCSNVATVNINNVSTDSLFTVNNFFWNFGVPNTLADTSMVRNPSYTYNQSGTYVITMWATAANGCRDSIRDTVSFNLVQARLNDTTWVCPVNNSVQLNVGGNLSYNYLWNPATSLSSNTAASPILSPIANNPVVYTVSISAPTLQGSNLTCTSLLSTVVSRAPAPTVEIITDTSTCAGSVQALAVSNPTNLAVQWGNNGSFNPILSTQNPILYQVAAANSSLFALVRNQYGCEGVDSVNISSSSLPIATNFTYVRGHCANPYPIQFINLTTDTSRGAIAGYNWTIRDLGGVIFSSSIANPSYNFQTSGVYTVTLQATSVQSCVGIAQSVVTVLVPAINNSDTVGICTGTSFVVLNPNGDARFQYLWSPSINLSSSTAVSPSSNTSVSRTYYVTITGIVGTDTCTVRDSVRVIRPTPLVVNVDSATIYCSNTVTLTAVTNRAVLSYEWSGDPSFFTILGRTNPATFSPTAFPLSGYYVRVRDNYGCTATDFAIVQQRLNPVLVNFNYGVIGCSDTLVAQFNDITTDTNSSVIVSRSWQTSDGQSSNLANPLFTFRQSGIYQITLTVRLSNGCVGTLSRNISFEVASINTAETIFLCNYENNLVLNPNGDVNLDYQWSPSVGLSANNVASPTATPPSFPFSYSVTVTGQNGLDVCVGIHNIFIDKPSNVFIDLMPDTVICSNNLLVGGIFDQNVSGIDWSFNNQFNPIVVSGVIPININFGNTTDTALLYARVTDIYGCTAVDSVQVARRIIPLDANFVFVADCTDNLLVDFQFTGQNPRQISNYSWNFGNGQTANYENPRINYPQSGTYPIDLQIRDIWGCIGRFSDTLSFNLAQINSLDSIPLCQIGNLILNPNGNSSLVYSWSPANLLNSSNIASPTATINQNSSFVVTVSSQNADFNCLDVRNIAVGVGNLSLNISNDTTICGNAITLQAFVNQDTFNTQQIATFLWALDRNFNLPLGYGANYTTNVNASRYFYLLAQDNYGCFRIDSVYVQVNRNPLQARFEISSISCGDSLNLGFNDITDTTLHSLVGWHWNFGDNQSSNLQNPTHFYPTSGNYTVQFSITASDGCVVNSSQPITIRINPLINQNDSLIICLGDSIRLNMNGDSSALYTWAVNNSLNNRFIYNPVAFPTQNSNYQAEVLSINVINGRVDSCIRTLFINVAVTNPILIVLVDSIFICANNFTVQANGGISSEWSNIANFSNILSNNSLFSGLISSNPQAFYYRSGVGSCFSYDSVIISSKPADISLNDSIFNCQIPSELRLEATNNQIAQNLIYSWFPTSDILQGQGTNRVLVDASDSLTFTVVGTNEFGCSDTATSNISLSGIQPFLQIYSSRDSINEGDTLQLVATPNLFNYQWENNPTLSNLFIPNPIASPIQTTTYIVSAESSDGCIIIDSIIINIRLNNCGEPYIFVPNAFTPDGDGLNDALFVRGANLNGLYFAVYNRWGELVFETNNQSMGWDGKFKGQSVSPDVYGFYLKCTCGDGQSYFKKGNVTLIR
jgi:gliding motility-associated-like protein